MSALTQSNLTKIFVRDSWQYMRVFLSAMTDGGS